MNRKGVALSYLNRQEDSIKAFDACIQKFGNETDTIIKQQVAWAMCRKGNALDDLKRYDDAIKAYDACIEKFSNETDTIIKKILRKGYALQGICSLQA